MELDGAVAVVTGGGSGIGSGIGRGIALAPAHAGTAVVVPGIDRRSASKAGWTPKRDVVVAFDALP
jgi:NAD(P)-dependent dehydrogenase (short-subunit alcohol dehydrogenase family)